MEITKKVCSPAKGCGVEKSINEFNRSRKSYSHICKVCQKQYRENNRKKISEKQKQYRENNKKYYRQYREVNKEKLKQLKKTYNDTDRAKELAKIRNKRYRENSKEKCLLNASRYRAKQKGLEHNITLEDISIPEFCPVLGVRLESNTNNLTAQNNSPSIDRIDNSKGYIKGNVRIISYRANAIKNNATIEELQKIINYMKTFTGENHDKL